MSNIKNIIKIYFTKRQLSGVSNVVYVYTKHYYDKNANISIKDCTSHGCNSTHPFFLQKRR